MLELPYTYQTFERPLIVKPNRITGEGRSRPRPFSAYKVKDQKKKQHRKMAKKSRRRNRGDA